MTQFNLEIITQEQTLLKAEVESLYVSTIDGDITVLARHTPYVSVLKPGEIIIKKDGKEESFACTGGILEITPEKTVILADSAVRSDEIDEEEAQKAKEAAEKLMAGKLESRESAETLAALERALLHLNIAQKRRHRRG
ncbi:MAG: ATP synthase F1 subunit epsilon [Parcubacteria group bacterium]|nr:ATP synthase F1 subunit epsilon [Parcubacteria group bacterium]